METLLTVAIVVTALAVVVQAVALVAMYVLSRRVAESVNGLVRESQKVLIPLERVAGNLKSTSNDVLEIGREAQLETYRLQSLLSDASESVRTEIEELRDRLNFTVDEIQKNVLKPVREFSAVARGISVGLRTLFRGRKPRTETFEEIRRTPAA